MTRRLLTSCIFILLFNVPVHADWIGAQGAQAPPKSVIAWQGSNGKVFYVCRAEYAGSTHPGRLVDSNPNCSISYDGSEHSVSKYEVLVGDGYSWVPAYNGEIPFDAVAAGKQEQSNILYVCRGIVDSEWYPGRIRRGDGGCVVAHAGKELKAPWYEVLVGN